MPEWLISIAGVALVAGTAIATQARQAGKYTEQLEEQKKVLSGDDGLVKQVNALALTCMKLDGSVTSLQRLMCDGLMDRVRQLELEMAVLKSKGGS